MAGTTTTRRSRPLITRGKLNGHLQKHLPTPMTDVLIPAIHWRIGSNHVTAVLPNQVWEDLFYAHAIPIFAKHPIKGLEEVKALSRIDSEDHGVSRPLTFTNLISDPGNEFPISAARQVLDGPGLTHNPFYIHGPSGSGKTHLLHAMADEFIEYISKDAVVQFSAAEWVSQIAGKLAERSYADFLAQIDEAVAILVDDVHLLGNRSVAQEQFFHLLNRCLDNGQQIVLTAPCPPKQLKNIEDRLITRFAWGLQVPMENPKLETRMNFLRTLAGSVIEDYDGQELGQLVESLAPDMHQVRVIADRLLAGEKISMVADNASFDAILEAVARQFSIRAGDIAGKRRHRDVAQARQTALLLGRRLTAHSLEALGGMVGGRDHSTVLYLIKQAESRVQEDEPYRLLVNQLTQAVLA